MALQVIGEIYNFLIKFILVVALAIIILHSIFEAIENYKEKKKLKKDNKK